MVPNHNTSTSLEMSAQNWHTPQSSLTGSNMLNTNKYADPQKNKIALGGLLMWLIVAIFYGLDYLQHTMPSVLILPISHSMGVDYVSVTNVMNVYFPVYALSQIPAGYIIDRLGLRWALFYASLVLTAGLLLMLAPGLHYVLGGRILIAIGSAFAWNGGLKAASSYLPKNLFPVMTGVLNTIGVIAGIGGMVFIEHLIGLRGWRPAIFDVAVFGMCWSVVILLFLRKAQTQHDHPHPLQPHCRKKSTLLQVFKDKQLWLVTLYAALITGAVMYTFAESYSVIILEKVKHIASNHAAWLNSVLFIGVGVGGPLHGIIAARFNRRKTWLSICAFGTLLAFIALILSIHLFSSITLLAVTYFSVGFFVSSMLLSYTIAKERFELNRHGLIFAFINMIGMLGGFVFPMIFGYLVHFSQHTFHVTDGLTLPLFALLVPITLSAIMTLFLAEKPTRPC